MLDPYGHVTVLDGNGTPRTANESLYGNRWTFTGRRLDGETGLMYYRNRMYSVDLGRFVSRDPLVHQESVKGVRSGASFVPDEFNIVATRQDTIARGWFYAYVSGRATVQVDPLGLATFTLISGPRKLDNKVVDFEFDVLIGGLEPDTRYFQIAYIEVSVLACGGGAPGFSKGNKIDDLQTQTAQNATHGVTSIPGIPGGTYKWDARTSWPDLQGQPNQGVYCSYLEERTVEVHKASTTKPYGGPGFFASVKIAGEEYKHVPAQEGVGAATSLGLVGKYRYQYSYWNPNCKQGDYTNYTEIIEQIRFYGGNLKNANNVRYADGKAVAIPGEPTGQSPER